MGMARGKYVRIGSHQIKNGLLLKWGCWDEPAVF